VLDFLAGQRPLQSAPWCSPSMTVMPPSISMPSRC
jgi:hypothetical protein